MQDQLYYGTVIWFKAMGFIKQDSGSKDIFVHYSNIIADPGAYKTLKAGQRVSYTIGANQKGPQAENVKVIEEAPEDE